MYAKFLITPFAVSYISENNNPFKIQNVSLKQKNVKKMNGTHNVKIEKKHSLANSRILEIVHREW